MYILKAAEPNIVASVILVYDAMHRLFGVVSGCGEEKGHGIPSLCALNARWPAAVTTIEEHSRNKCLERLVGVI